MENIKITIDTIYGDALQNAFMHACDVFEQGKHLGIHEQMVLELSVGDKNLLNYDNIITKLKESFENLKKNVIFMSIIDIDGIKTNQYKPYIKEGVQSISNGQNWSLFRDYLTHMGYEVETNQRVVVTSAKLII